MRLFITTWGFNLITYAMGALNLYFYLFGSGSWFSLAAAILIFALSIASTVLNLQARAIRKRIQRLKDNPNNPYDIRIWEDK